MTYKVPFAPDGSLLHDVDWWQEVYEWREPEPFYAMLKIKDMYRSGHSVYYVWEGAGNRVYPMLVNDMLALLKSANISAGYVTANWEIVKRGRAYGIRKVPN